MAFRNKTDGHPSNSKFRAARYDSARKSNDSEKEGADRGVAKPMKSGDEGMGKMSGGESEGPDEQNAAGEEQEPQKGEQMHEMVAQHGPAHELHFTHDHAAGRHHLHSVHQDGYEHHSDHADAATAHEDGKTAAGIENEGDYPAGRASAEPDDDYEVAALPE